MTLSISIHFACYFSQMRSLFASRNIASLQQLNGGDILLDVCVELVYLKRYLAYYQDCVRGGDYIMPTSMSEAMSTRTRWGSNVYSCVFSDVYCVH